MNIILYMNIGIDASHLNPKAMSGTQKFLSNLLHNIALLDTHNTYTIFVKHDISEYFFRSLVNSNPNFSFYKCLKYPSWTQVGLALEVWKRDLDILLCPWQTMPVIHKPSLKIISIIHGLEYKKLHFGPTLYTSIYSDKLIAVSNFTKYELNKRFKIPNERISVIYEGINTNTFYKRPDRTVIEIKNKYDISNKYFLFVGYLVKRKNMERMLLAFKEFVERSSIADLSFVIAGNISDECKGIHDFVISINMESHVKFLGYVPDKDLPFLLSGAHALCYVSISEGFGLPVLEAMACKTPVLTSTTGALPEVSGNSAYLCDPFDTDNIAKGMSTLYGDAKVRNALIYNGLENIKRFTWKQTATELLNLFNSK